MNSQNNLLYFLHIPKTAGSSLSYLLRNHYQPQLWLPAATLPELLTLRRQDINTYQCFGGHFGTGLFSLLDRPVSCITMLRDPFEQFISNINFARKIINNHKLDDYPIEYRQYCTELINICSESNYIERIINHPFFIGIFANYQTRYLGCHLDLQPFLGKGSPSITLDQLIADQTDMEVIFNSAKRTLDPMAAVGIVENFGDSCRLICNFLGISFQGVCPQLNIAPGRQKGPQASYRQSGIISADLADRIDELIQYDYKIYAYGKAIFDRQLQELNKKPRESNDKNAKYSNLSKFFFKLRSFLG